MTTFSFILFLTVAVSCAHTDKNTKYLDPNCNAEQWHKGFSDPKKDTVAHQKEMLRQLPLTKGDVVADVGAGTGQFEGELSKLVGSKGKVYAVDVAPAFIPFMKKRFEQEGLTNVEVIHGKIESTTLPEHSVNLVLLIDTYHHFDDPQLMLKDFKRILKKEGHLVVVDFKRGPGARAWINEHVEKTKEDYIKEISSNCFEFLREEKIPFRESFQLTFQSRASCSE